MKKLTQDLKRMLNALASQHAADYLSMQQKIGILGGHKVPSDDRAQRLALVRTPRPIRRIALLHDGREQSALLDFVVDACRRQGQPVQVDVLLHGSVQPTQLEFLQQRLCDARIAFEFRSLGDPAIDLALDYLQHAGSLISVVAQPDDAVARRLIEQVLPGAGERLYVPVVLIGSGKADENAVRRSAA